MNRSHGTPAAPLYARGAAKCGISEHHRKAAKISKQPKALAAIKAEILRACDDLMYKRSFGAPAPGDPRYEHWQELTSTAEAAIAGMKSWRLEDFSDLHDWNSDPQGGADPENRAALNVEHVLVSTMNLIARNK